jgi:uncharacterized protein
MARGLETLLWRQVSCGIVVRVHLTPRSSRDGIDGMVVLAEGPVLKVRVRAVPEDGKANAALEGLLADWLGIGKRSVTVTGGQTSRTKAVTIDGPPDVLIRTLEAHFALS